jgi:hypothetical protein
MATARTTSVTLTTGFTLFWMKKMTPRRKKPPATIRTSRWGPL